MGPRSHERGNQGPTFTDGLLDPRTLLQWGRVLMNAETSMAKSK